MTPQSSTLQLTPSYFPGTSEPRTADFRDAEINSINLWLDVVQCYTKCRATMSSDKLPAILGLLGKIKQVARLTDHYGVIFDESPTSLRTLLWYRAQPSLFKPKPWRAPSWSWAALDGAILMPYRSIHRDVGGIHDCVLRSLGWAPPPYYPTAELIRFERHEEREDVQLTISAPLFEMETLFTPAPVGRDTKCPHSEEWPAGTYLATVVNGDKNLDDTHRVCFDSWEDTPPKFYLAVFFLHQRVHKFNNSMLTVRICLALRKAGRDRWENTRYRRVGLGMVAGDHPLPDKQVITLV